MGEWSLLHLYYSYFLLRDLKTKVRCSILSWFDELDKIYEVRASFTSVAVEHLQKTIRKELDESTKTEKSKRLKRSSISSFVLWSTKYSGHNDRSRHR